MEYYHIIDGIIIWAHVLPMNGCNMKAINMSDLYSGAFWTPSPAR